MSWVLFVFQDANFCPKSVMFSKDDFEAARPKDLELLIKHAKKMEHGYLLVQNYVWNDGCGTMKKHEWSHVTQDIQRVAEISSDEDKISRLGDEVWVLGCQRFQTTLFDPREVFEKLIAQVSFSDAFLVLEANNGEVRAPPVVRDVNEMYKKYY